MKKKGLMLFSILSILLFISCIAYSATFVGMSGQEETLNSFSDADATPDVTGGGKHVLKKWQTANTGSTTITDFDDGDDHSEFRVGDVFKLRLDDQYTTIDCSNNSNIECNANIDLTGSASQILYINFEWDGDRWIGDVISGFSNPTTLAVVSIEQTTLEDDELTDEDGSPYALVEDELKYTIISTANAASTVEYQFPARGEGWNFVVIKEANQTVTLTPNGVEQWWFRADSYTAYTQLTAGYGAVNDTNERSDVLCYSTEIGVYCTGSASWEATSSDPCEVMGATGTYELWWNGEYDSDIDKACLDSGASTADAAEATAGVIVVGGAINGSYGALLDTADEHVRWSNSSTTLDNAGTVQFNVTTPASFSASSMLFELYYNVNNMIIVHLDIANANKVRIRRSGNANVDQAYSENALSTSTTHTIYVTWQDSATETQCFKVDAGSWFCTNADLGTFSSSIASIAIGDDQAGLASISDSWKIDDFQVREGYEGP